MWARNRLQGQKRLPRFALTDVYGLFVDDAKHLVTDADGASPEQVWQRMAPTGNIYRLNAMHAEHLKHQEDLQAQLAALAVRHAALLDRAEASETPAPDAAELQGRRPESLLRLLMAAVVRQGDAEQGKVVGAGFPPLHEFLCPSATERHLGGMLLLPKNPEGKRAAVKNRVIALLIMTIQILGPFMILLNNWNADTNYLRGGRFIQYMTWEEFTCVGPLKDALVTFMGMLFLVLVSEIVRHYAKDQVDNMAKLRHLPADTFWHQLGDFTNMACILLTTLAMPLLFWAEMSPKEIVFDSLSMLFVFSLDDLAGGALGFLELGDAEFQQMTAWMVALLGQCPLVLDDLTDTEAKSPEAIWQIRRSPKGVLLCARDGQPCRTRLASLAASESTPLADGGLDDDCVFEDTAFEYAVSPAGPRIRLPSGRFLSQTITTSWGLLYYLLGVLEMLVPIVFVTISKPCTAP